jgi:ferric-dicitrate binding protein FerR (iron transport regulator)
MTDVDWDLLFRYFGNECSAEERERFERWLAADPRHQTVVDAAIVAAGRTLEGSRPALHPPRINTVRRRDASRAWPLAAAASLLVVAAGALLVKHAARPASVASSASVALDIAQTDAGARRELRLADGTRVILGPRSTMRYPHAFGDGTRDVYLTGQGYFEVVHDARHPFRVHAGHATAEDVGTAFGVLAYAQDSVVRVVVAEGSVSLGRAANGRTPNDVLLTRGDLGSLAPGIAPAAVRRVNVDAYLGWTEGRLVFDETPLHEVATQLGRWYGTSFRIADGSLASRTLTASFTTQSLDEVLASLAPVLDVRFDHVGDTVVVRPR